MSKVLFVDQRTGNVKAIDIDGNPEAIETDLLTFEEATVLINRLAEGYVQIPNHHYAVRIELVNTPDGNQVFEIIDIVKYDYMGNQKVVKAYSLVDTQAAHEAEEHNWTMSLCRLDLSEHKLTWLENPLDNDPYTAYFDDAAVVGQYSPAGDVMHCVSLLHPTQAPGAVMMNVYFKD